MDGGRSGCRARLSSPPAPPVEASGAPLPILRGAGAARETLRALDGTLAGLPSTRADVAVAGLAGVAEQPEHAAAVAAGLAARTGARRVVVAGDLVTSHAGALGGDAGVVVAAGTGAVAFAVGREGRTGRADGWGYLLGDEGSGFWIGRAGLAAALAQRDGRGGSPALRARAQAAFGALERLPELVHRGDAVAVIAAFAKEVAAAAGEGDPVAHGLWRAAGARLAATAAAAAAQVLTGPAAASYAGGLFAAGELLLEPFRVELARRSTLTLRHPAGGALDGAELLARSDRLPAGPVHVHDRHA